MQRVFSAATAPLAFLMATIPTGYLAAGTVPESSDQLWVDGPNDVQPGTDRTFPDAAADPQGRSIFVWSASAEVFMRRFDDEGNPLANPVMINTTVDNIQRHARLAVNRDGSFLVIWQSWEQDPELDPGFERVVIRSRAFDSDGAALGPEQLVSTLSTRIATDVSADVAALGNGGYVAVWTSRKSPGLEDDQFIQARLINTSGVPTGSQFKANASVGPNVRHPAVTQLNDGGFLVVWSVPEVQARRFTSDGTPVGGDFQVNTFTDGSEVEIDAALHSDGRTLIVWEDDDAPGDDDEIRGRMYDPDLEPLGDDFRINSLITDDQRTPRVGAFGSVGFFVAWGSESSGGDDDAGLSIQGRFVTASDQFDGSDFQINSWTLNNQQHPGISGLDGRLAIAWRTLGHDGEPNDDGIIGQFWFVCGIFCDGFEN